jgi:hypothetical protein
MGLTIRIETDSAAFADDMAGEIRRLLDELSRHSNTIASGLNRTLLDVNGNVCGRIWNDGADDEGFGSR